MISQKMLCHFVGVEVHLAWKILKLIKYILKKTMRKQAFKHRSIPSAIQFLFSPFGVV